MLSYSIERLLRAETLGQVRQPFLDAMASRGFEQVLYSARFMLALPSSLAHREDVLLTNLPEALTGALTETVNGLPPNWARWIAENDGDISAQELNALMGPDTLPACPERESLQKKLAAAHVVSLRGFVPRSIGAVVLIPWLGAAGHDLARRWRPAAAEIRILCSLLHLRVATMRRERNPAILTARQREVLEWRSAGKTIAEIATILGVTPATVEKHMRLAREALGAATTPQAILKAHLNDELFPEDPAQQLFG
ncbi:MAG: helix-turn-helix transcriptional regulator [Paracoccus sp. (in: a-proteobacteria)]|nr:helix-turn-helix transcriptional regulator [Paracoccus sp. (in: a-proteobacteria)]